MKMFVMYMVYAGSLAYAGIQMVNSVTGVI